MALLLLGACGQADNTLSGSIAETHALSFDTVQVRVVGGAYTIAYLRGSAPETVARLIWTPAANSPPVGQAVPLDFGNSGNAALSRATSDGLSFPQPQSGNLTWNTDLSTVADGKQVSGHFGVLFAGGQTLDGSFSAALSVAAVPGSQ